MSNDQNDLVAVLAILKASLDLPLAKPDLAAVREATAKGVVQIASAHAVLPLLAYGCDKQQIAQVLDSDLRLFISEMRDRNRQRCDAIRDQLTEIGKALAAEGIDGVVLKGGADLLAPVYPAGGRFILDLDILIPLPQLSDASRALQRMGYVYLELEEDYHHERHLPALQHPERPAVVELHRRIGNDRWNAVLPADLIQATSLDAEMAGLRAPPPAVRFLHALVHTQVDGRPGEPEPLKLRDLAELELIGRDLSAADRQFIRQRCNDHGAALEHEGSLAVQSSLLGSNLHGSYLLGGNFATQPQSAEVEKWTETVRTLLGAPGRRRWSYLASWLLYYVRRLRDEPEVRKTYLARLFKPSYLALVFRFHRNHLRNIR